MNTSSEERFHELAHKTLAGEADAAEREELQSWIAKSPEFKDEFQQLAATREVLELLNDLPQLPRGIPQTPTRLLRERVSKVFEKPLSSIKQDTKRQPSIKEDIELLRKFQAWVRSLVGSERSRMIELIPLVRRTLLEETRRTHLTGIELRLVEEAETGGSLKKIAEMEMREFEFKERLRSLHERIGSIYHSEAAHLCRKEIRGLLQDMTWHS
jgi:hypothetical protein